MNLIRYIARLSFSLSLYHLVKWQMAQLSIDSLIRTLLNFAIQPTWIIVNGVILEIRNPKCMVNLNELGNSVWLILNLKICRFQIMRLDNLCMTSHLTYLNYNEDLRHSSCNHSLKIQMISIGTPNMKMNND